MSRKDKSDRNRLVSVTLDEASVGRGAADQEHERQIAIYDLVDENSFALPGRDAGPYGLNISLQESKLALEVVGQNGTRLATHILSL
ncbi:MAG: UPF0262 family protein, partial [Methylocapsa sp.]|nr:UPF0262 family protein [Methylocapsa sp.]